MKPHKSLKSYIIPLGLAVTLTSVARADFNPVPLTAGSYNFDIVIEKTAFPSLQDSTTASQGGGTNKTDSTWFELGYWRGANTNIGVPHPGQVFTNQSKPNIQYIMPPTYLTNNGLLCDSTQPGQGGTLTLATPTTCTGLSIFGSSGGGNATVGVTIIHADSTVELVTISFNDWFNGANPAWTAGGRIGMPGGGFGNNGANPRLYSAEVTNSSASPVTAVSFLYGATGGTPAVYAISTTTDGTTYTPAVVSGFNQRIIAVATPLPFACNATMDQGTNLAENGNLATWFEEGYIVGNATNGLPPSGSTFNSLSQPTHHYQMGNYSANNAILIDTNHQVANITPASPVPYTSFALLTAGGNAGSGQTNICILQHANGLNETNSFLGYDWFEGSRPTFIAWQSGGRVNMEDRDVNAVGTVNPKLFETYFTLADSVSPVTNIILQYVHGSSTSSTTFIMAVSASAGAVAPVVNTQPTWVDAYPGTSASFTVGLGAGTTPTFMWQKASSPAGPFTTLTDGGHISNSGTATLNLSSIDATDAGYYQVVITNVAGSTTSAPPVALYLLTSTASNVLLPGDSISDASFPANAAPNAGANETVTSVLDGTTQKYLCYGIGPSNGLAPYAGPSGFIVTPGSGNTVVTAMRIYAANDAPERDPADIMLEGSSDGGSTWTTILPDTAIAMPDNRNAGGSAINITNQVLQEIDFANSTGYTTYRVTVNNVKTNDIANGMQFAELQLLGAASGPPVVVTPFTLPETSVAVVGSTAILNVGEAGTLPITNQWTLNSVNLTDGGRISGSQSNVLTISNVQLSDAGYYQLNITNGAGSYSVYPGGGADQNLLVVADPTFFTNGAGWMANGGAVITNNVLTLTDGANGEARTFFFKSPMYVGAFEASFIYQDVGGVDGNNADGASFCLQNDPRGAAAVGGGGGALALSGITPSAALTFNLYAPNSGGIGMSYGTNGANGNPYNSVAPVDISGGDPITVKMLYRNGVAQVTLTDTTSNLTFGTNITIGSLTTLLGGQTAYVGFTGATGGVNSTQTITDFNFVPLTTLSVSASGGNVILSWPTVPAGYVLQSESNPTSNTWAPVGTPVIVVGGQNTVTIPATSSPQFYRVAIPVPAQ